MDGTTVRTPIIERLGVRQKIIKDRSQNAISILNTVLTNINEISSMLISVVKNDRFKENEKLIINSGKIRSWKSSLQNNIELLNITNEDLLKKGISSEEIIDQYNSQENLDSIEAVVNIVKTHSL